MADKQFEMIALATICYKLSESSMYKQIYRTKPLILFFDFHKGHNTEQCLNVMLENWKKVFDGKICLLRVNVKVFTLSYKI